MNVKELDPASKAIMEILSDGKPRGFNELFRELKKRNKLKAKKTYIKKIRELEKNGFIERATDPWDTRKRLVVASRFVKEYVLEPVGTFKDTLKGILFWAAILLQKAKENKEEDKVPAHFSFILRVFIHTSTIFLAKAFYRIKNDVLRNWALSQILTVYMVGLYAIHRLFYSYFPNFGELWEKDLKKLREKIEKVQKRKKHIIKLSEKEKKEICKKVSEIIRDLNRQFNAPAGI